MIGFRHFTTAAATTIALVLAADPAWAAQDATPVASGVLIPVETYKLPNGLSVVFHVDRSDPVVAVVLAAHVGSAREEPGRTGFAHLFEHLFFLDSENLGTGGLDRMSARIGGSGANGSTSRDVTDYLQTVPNDALEKMIWAEADKLGYFINTVTDPVLAKEKEVVKNEKRQSVDNEPYGHTDFVVSQALYAADHPYSWPVIGSLADLDAATLDDVKGFYRRWYTPDNATLVIAGDFDTAQARGWIEKYFGEIASGPGVAAPATRAATLSADVRLMHEDAFAQLPELGLVWPTVERTHPDRAALDVLLELLTDGKEAPLTAVLVDEKKLTSDVSAFLYSSQIAGEARLSVRAFDGVDLDAVRAALDEGFTRFETRGVDPAALERVKTSAEAGFYSSLDSVLGKGSALARYDVYGGSPDADLAALRAVTAQDVMRVYQAYIADRPAVVTSFVPRGQVELAVAESAVAPVVEEAIVQGAEAAVDPRAEQATYTRTPSSFDRTVEPPSGPAPVITPPVIWSADLPNGLKVSGIQNAEIPLATFQISIDGGRLFDDLEEPGAANLVARMFDRGTATKTPAELENALKALGASVRASAGSERFVISGQTLDRNLPATLALVEEMLLQPRWNEAELTLAKAAVTAEIQDARSQPGALAARVMNLVSFGEDHILSTSGLGTEASVAALTMEDLKQFQSRNLAPGLARLYVVSPGDQASVTAAVAGLGQNWTARDVTVPTYPAPAPPAMARLYVYDVPDAKQSTLLFGYPALRRADPDYYAATVMNYRLGGGGFASRLTQQLREGQGYTYGVRSGFQGGARYGEFQLSSPVRTNVTLEAAQLARSIMADYGDTFTEEDLDVTRSAVSKSRARAFETATAKIGVLASVGEYGLPTDYLSREAAVIDALTVEQVKALADRYIRPDAMTYVVVGDAATQAERLKALGVGEPVLMNTVLEETDR